MQTVVQWLDRWFRDNPEATHEEGNKALEQANKMFEQQILDAFTKGADDGYDGIYDSNKEQYYNETYRSKGSDATSSQTEKCCTPEGQIKRYVDCIGCDRKASSQTTSDKWKEYQDWLNEVPEISDEEIEKAAREYWKRGQFGFEKPSDTEMAWVKACKWYREQLKQK